MRVAVTEAGHRDPAGKIEKSPTVGSVKIETFAPFDGNIPPTVGRHNSWYHGSLLSDLVTDNQRERVYRRRRCATHTAARPFSQCRLALQGSPLIALSSLRRAGSAAPAVEQESGGV